MTEEEAQQWLSERFDPTRLGLVRQFVGLVKAENERHNLIAPATIPTIWTRHVVDSAQLVGLGVPAGRWLDVGTGGGFPGVIVALLRDAQITLVEPRRLRAEFLSRCVDELGLGERVTVKPAKVELMTQKAAIISARAVGSVEKLLQAAACCATLGTRWILPRGRSAADDLAIVRQRWNGVFHVEQSITDLDAGILLLEKVQQR